MATAARPPLLLDMPHSIYENIWPANRVALGLRVCRQLRRELPQHAHAVDLRIPEQEERRVVRYAPDDAPRAPSSAPGDEERLCSSCMSDLGIWGPRVALHFDMRDVTAKYPVDTVLRALAASPASVVSICVKTAREDVRETVMDALVDVIRASRARSQPLQSITLSVPGLRAGLASFARFAHELAGLPHLTRLDLHGGDMCESTLQVLAASLPALTALVELNLGRNHLGSENVMKNVAAGLAGLTRLLELGLADVNMRTGGLKALSNVFAQAPPPSLASLDLGENRHIYGCGEHLARVVRSCTNLAQLTLARCDLFDDDVQPLFRELEHPHASHTALTDLDLSVNAVFSLHGTEYFRRMVDAGGCRGLVRLNIDFNSISGHQARELGDALPPLVALRSLNLARNAPLGNSDEVHGLVHMLANCSDLLTELDLSENEISSASMSQLGPTLTRLTSITRLSVGYNNLGLAGLDSLRRAVSAWPHLTDLNLRSVARAKYDAGHVMAEILRASTSLRTLNASWNYITGKGARRIARALSQHASLTDLELAHNFIGDAGAIEFCEIPPRSSLTTLNLLDNNIISKQTFRQLGAVLGPTLVAGVKELH